MPIKDKNGSNISVVRVVQGGTTYTINKVDVVKNGTTTTVFSVEATPPPFFTPPFFTPPFFPPFFTPPFFTPPFFPPFFPPPNFLPTVTVTYIVDGATYSTKTIAKGTAPGDPVIGNPPGQGFWSPDVNVAINEDTTYSWVSA